MRTLISCIVALLVPALFVPVAASQVITVEPAFPNEEKPVTIFFNAKEGDGGLAEYTGDVYTQTGVVTSAGRFWRYLKTDWDQNTPDTKLERISEDFYRLHIPDIRAYYNNSHIGEGPIPDNERILKLSFDFRSADGKRQGRNVGAAVSADICVDLFPPGVHVRLAEPVVGPVLSSLERPRVRVDTALSVVAVAGAIGTSLSAVHLLVDDKDVVQTTRDTLRYLLPYQPGRVATVRIIAEAVDGAVDSTFFDAVFIPRPGPTSARRSWLPDPRFESIALGSDVPGAPINAILQDHRGYLWLGTSNGLYRYDGYTSTVYQHDPDESNSLSHNLVYTLFEDAAGLLWIGTYSGGLNRFDPETETFILYRHDPNDPKSLSNDWVASVYEDSHGVLWVGTHTGLDRLNPSTGAFSHYTFDEHDPHSLGFGRVETIYEDNSGTLWLGTWGGGLGWFDRATESFTHHLSASYNRHTLSNNFVQSIYEDRDGMLWIGTAAGLDRFDRERGTFRRYRFETDNPVGLRTVNSMHQDADGRLWIGAYGGLYRLDPITGDVSHYRHDPNDPNSVRHSDIFKIYEDRSGTLWIGTRSGLDKMKRAPFAPHRYVSVAADSASNMEVHAVYEDHSGVVWIGMLGGMARFDRDTQTYTFFPYPRSDPTVNAQDLALYTIVEDQSGTLWVGTNEGVSRFDRQTETYVHYPHDPVITPDQVGAHAGITKVVPAIYEAPSQPGVLWVGTRTDLFRFDPKGTGEFVHHLLETTHPQGWHTVYAIYEAPSQPGVLWIGTVGGLNKLDMATGQIVHYRHDLDNPHSLSGDEVYAIYEDPARALWVGTRDGLNRFDRESETFTRFTTRDGLPDNFVKGILGDDQGHLWISTGNGLSRFNPTTLTFRNYDARDGLPGNVFLEGAYHRNQRGELFFGGQEGFTLFHPKNILDNPQAPPVVLTDFKVLGKSVDLGQPLGFTPEIELIANQNTFSFEFAALDYAAPEQNRYAYRLDGFDKEWVENGTRRFARYPNVPPGTYVFRVRGSNSDGVWNEEGASIRIVVAPPFWRTGWFFASCLVFVLSLATAAGYIARTRRLKHHALELRKMVEERTRELVAEKQKTEEQARRLVELDEAKNRLFANISHEFRTPLTLILGPLQDLLDRRASPEALARSAPVMLRSARRLLRLVNQFLDLSRLESGRLELHPEPGDLVPFVRNLVRAFVPLAERRRLALTFHTDAETLPLAFDADALEKIVSNLVSNALTFTSEGGKVLVTLKTADRDDASYATLSVKDTGPGIAEEDRARIFDRFQQADTSIRRQYEGSGVGLALAKELTKLHGGRLELESEVGFGSTFTVVLPLPATPPVLAEGAPDVAAGAPKTPMLEEAILRSADDGHSEAAVPEGEKPLVLIVEDNPDVRAYLRDHLEADYDLLEAEDGEAGLEAARAHMPDLILADVMMPRMDGYEMCRLIKANEKLREIPVVMLTARAAERDTVEGLRSGADDYLAKPFSVPELKARVSNLIASRRELRAQYSREIVVQPAEITITAEQEVFLDQVLEAVNAHLGDANFTMDWLAEEVGLSRRQLERRVTDVTGETPAQLMRRLRLERASQLLRAHAGTVAEIAYAVGFHSPSHFSTAFREAFGETPTEHAAQESGVSS